MWTTQSWYQEAFAAARSDAPRVNATARYWLRIYEESLPGQSREQIGRLLADYNQKRLRAVPDLGRYPDFRSIMQYRGPDGIVCDNGDVLFPGDPPIEHTIRTQIVCLREARALWWTRDNATGTPSWQHPMPEVKFENALPWE